MSSNQKYFIDLLSQFYDKTVKVHPQRVSLLQKKRKHFHPVTVSRQKSISNGRKTITTSQERLSPTNILGKSRGKSLQSDKESNDSRLSHKRLKIDEYFKCQFVYESSSFVKSLMYAYLFLTANVQNVDLLVYLKEKFLEDYSDYFQSVQLRRMQFYWNKIILCVQKKQKYWQKSFLSSFKHFHIEFCNKLFQTTVKTKPQSLYLSNITPLTIKKISQSLGYGVNYYHVSKKFIRSEIKQGQEIKFCLNIVYIQQLERWMVSDRPLQKPSEDENCQKIKQIMGENISKLLGKYEKGNETLSKLTRVLGYDTVINTEIRPLQTQLKRNSKYISLKVL